MKWSWEFCYIIRVVFMQHKNVFLLDTCFWLISAIIIYLIYPIIYCIIWVERSWDVKRYVKYKKIWWVAEQVTQWTEDLLLPWFPVRTQPAEAFADAGCKSGEKTRGPCAKRIWQQPHHTGTKKAWRFWLWIHSDPVMIWTLFWLLVIPIKIWIAFQILLWVYKLWLGMLWYIISYWN